MKKKTKLLLLIVVNFTTIYMFGVDSGDIVNNGLLVLNPIVILGMYGIILQMSVVFSGKCFTQDSSLSMYSFFRGKTLFRVLISKFFKNVIPVMIVMLVISLLYSSLFNGNETFVFFSILLKAFAVFLSLLYYMVLEFIFDESKAFMIFNIISLLSLIINIVSILILNINLSLFWPTNFWFYNLSSWGLLPIMILISIVFLSVSSVVMKQKNII